MKQNIVLMGIVLAFALGSAASSSDSDDGRFRALEERIRHLEEHLDRVERHNTHLGFEHDRRPDYGRSDCDTGEVATGIGWQDKTLRCAALTNRDY